MHFLKLRSLGLAEHNGTSNMISKNYKQIISAVG